MLQDEDVPDIAAAMSPDDNRRLPWTPAGRPSSEQLDPPPTDEEQAKILAREPVAWRELPRKEQLIIITLARMSEPLVQTSLQVRSPPLFLSFRFQRLLEPTTYTEGKTKRLHSSLACFVSQSYMYYQLKWFNPESPDTLISSQAGMLHASFMAAQFLTAMAWGRVADSPRAGRKTVLLIGLLGTSLSCLGFGFATNFWQALAFRTLGGSTNGNIGVMRTMYVCQRPQSAIFAKSVALLQS